MRMRPWQPRISRNNPWQDSFPSVAGCQSGRARRPCLSSDPGPRLARRNRNGLHRRTRRLGMGRSSRRSHRSRYPSRDFATAFPTSSGNAARSLSGAYVSFGTAAETGGRVHSEIPAHQGRRCTRRSFTAVIARCPDTRFPYRLRSFTAVTSDRPFPGSGHDLSGAHGIRRLMAHGLVSLGKNATSPTLTGMVGDTALTGSGAMRRSRSAALSVVDRPPAAGVGRRRKKSSPVSLKSNLPGVPAFSLVGAVRPVGCCRALAGKATYPRQTHGPSAFVRHSGIGRSR